MSKPRAPATDPRQPDLIQVTRPRARDPIGAALRDAYDPDDTLPGDWIELLAAIDQSPRRGGGHEHG